MRLTLVRAFWLLSLVGSVVLLPVVAGAQPPDEEVAESGVTCDAEFDDFEGYVVERGTRLECEATGLDPDADATWQVDFFEETWMWDEEEDEPIIEHVGKDGATIGADDHEGVIAFGFDTPDDIHFGWFEGEVIQGEQPDHTYHEEFFGLVYAVFVDGPISCGPDPARPGDEVSCLAEEMEPDDDYWWHVHLWSAREIAERLFLDDDEDGWEEFWDPDLEGSGTADEGGTGGFTFDIPTDHEIDFYLVWVWQDEYDAEYRGHVIRADEVEVTPTAQPSGSPPQPAGSASQPSGPAQQPNPVQPPTRIDTGAGGSALEGTWRPLATMLVLLGLLVAPLVNVRETARRGIVDERLP
jgi:hypothetical protein